MKKLLIGFAILLVMCGYSYAATVEADSCSLAHVQAAHDAADRGDTVTVPAGSCTWSSYLSITKSITLQGAGAGVTTITTGFSAVPGAGWGFNPGQNLIYIKPANIASDTDVLMRITGFTFVLTSGSYKVGGILVNNFSNTPLSKLRIDNNVFQDAYWDGNNNAYCAIGVAYSTAYGVIDSNTFTGGEPHIYLKGRGQTSWNAFNWTYGTANSIYLEDNTFNVSTLPTNNGNGISNVWRYNDITLSTEEWALDLGNSHGNDTNTGTWASFGSELYGNDVTVAEGAAFLRFGALRAGRNVVFYNRVNSGSNIAVMEYESTNGAYGYDYGSPTNTICPTGTLYYNGTRTGCSPDGSPQHVNQTYIWNNREGSGDGTIMDITNYTPTAPTLKLRQNVDFFSDYLGSTYMGCGSSAPTGNCSAGAGYWVTSQSCTTVPAAGLGANPATPISGTLYRCYPTNTWTAYYTPYTYPHPLREVNPDTTAPVMTFTSPLIAVECEDESEPYTQTLSLALTTDEPATCKYTIGTNEAYADLDETFTGTGTTSHTATTAAQSCGASYTIYYACQDDEDTPNVATTASKVVTISAGDDSTPPVRTNTTTANQSCTSGSLLMTVSTDEASTCKWDTEAATAYADMDNYFSVTGGESVHHSVNLTGQACSSTVSRYVRCEDTQGNVNTDDLTVPITTDAGKTVSGIDLGTGPLTISIGSGSLTINIIP